MTTIQQNWNINGRNFQSTFTISKISKISKILYNKNIWNTYGMFFLVN